jgi:hypothetical protein
MAITTLLLGVSSIPINSAALVENCSVFTQNPRLATSPYTIRSSIPLSALSLFVDALEGRDVSLTSENSLFLYQLSQEIGCTSLASRVSSSGEFPQFNTALVDALLSRVSGFETLALERQRRISELEGCLERFEKSQVIRTAGASGRCRTGELDSCIVSNFSDIFDRIESKRFTLLWRGSRDGYLKADFHRQCDGHANTVVVIKDTGDNIFGAFTPVEWEAREWNGVDGEGNNCVKSDPTLQSFLFSLKNPHGTSPKRFALRPERHGFAVGACRGSPFFGYAPPDISIAGNATAPFKSYALGFGTTYVNDSGFDGATFFTGGRYFTVKEIEVFEVTEKAPEP